MPHGALNHGPDCSRARRFPPVRENLDESQADAVDFIFLGGVLLGIGDVQVGADGLNVEWSEIRCVHRSSFLPCGHGRNRGRFHRGPAKGFGDPDSRAGTWSHTLRFRRSENSRRRGSACRSTRRSCSPCRRPACLELSFTMTAEAPPFHAAMVPSSVTKINFAAVLPGRAKSLVPLATTPVGEECWLNAGRHRNRDRQGLVSDAVVNRRQAGAVVRNPHWASGAAGQSPRIYELGVMSVQRVRAVSGNAGYQIRSGCTAARMPRTAPARTKAKVPSPICNSS